MIDVILSFVKENNKRSSEGSRRSDKQKSMKGLLNHTSRLANADDFVRFGALKKSQEYEITKNKRNCSGIRPICLSNSISHDFFS